MGRRDAEVAENRLSEKKKKKRQLLLFF